MEYFTKTPAIVYELSDKDHKVWAAVKDSSKVTVDQIYDHLASRLKEAKAKQQLEAKIKSDKSKATQKRQKRTANKKEDEEDKPRDISLANKIIEGLF